MNADLARRARRLARARRLHLVLERRATRPQTRAGREGGGTAPPGPGA
ncbi:hypothetical protein [Motilibacter aurantiacus]|nr:hypothetical protein [Motilibacter aurantiacus]NHC45186.1 hypothetical protein [Motilibacter aurantiacus]